MAKSAITLAAPPADEAADALLSTKKLIKPKKSGSIKGILAGAAAVSFALGLLAAVTPSLRQALVGLTGDQWSLAVEGGLGSNREFPLHSVDPNYVSFVVDPASLEIIPRYPSYPYPVDFTSPALKALVKELAPALFVITGGNSNCISYGDGFDPGSSPKSSADNYLSTYCEGKTYYGNLEPALFKTLLDFAADTGTDLIWHLNMAFGRGHKSPAYEPWDASMATGLLETAGSALKGALLFEEMPKKGKKVGFDITPDEMANDLSIMKAALPSDKTLVYGVLNQDSDQDKKTVTDPIYQASKDSIDIVAFSYYMNNAWRRAPENHGSYSGSGRCEFDPKQTAAFMVEPAHRATLDTTSKHFVELGESLGKPVQLIAGAPCTHAKEGTGYGAVDAHVGALWYADALGRVAKQGVRVFARQTLIGGVYGLLGTTTDKLAPTPGYWVAVLHKRLMGTAVLSVKAHGPEGFSAYAHCSKGVKDSYALLLVNFAGDDVTLTLPKHGSRTEYVLTSPDGLTTSSTLANPHSGKCVLNGGDVLAATNGELPALDGRAVDGSTKLTVPAEAVAFVVMEGIKDGISGC